MVPTDVRLDPSGGRGEHWSFKEWQRARTWSRRNLISFWIGTLSAHLVQPIKFALTVSASSNWERVWQWDPAGPRYEIQFVDQQWIVRNIFSISVYVSGPSLSHYFSFRRRSSRLTQYMRWWIHMSRISSAGQHLRLSHFLKVFVTLINGSSSLFCWGWRPGGLKLIVVADHPALLRWIAELLLARLQVLFSAGCGELLLSI